MEPQEKPARVIVTNLDIELGTMMLLLLKLVIAAIPAAVLLAILTTGVSIAVQGFIAGLS